ncbi:MAG: trypsin-like serine protease [Gammaproteobacteria bacterium]|jgi:secreted trypsin-like serine protease|nr:trypsin-like serine protease [Gammaproteobacteria bacterium]
MKTVSSPKFLSSLLAGLLIALLGFPQAQAIIIRHDQADSRYVVYAQQYPQLFYLHTRFNNKNCVATLISQQWAITAGHCTEQTPLGEMINIGADYSVSLDGEDYKITELVIHPSYMHPQQSEAVDLALIKLDRPVTGISPIDLYQGVDEMDKVVSFVGWGFTGMGTQGGMDNDGKMRRAQNTVMNAGKWLEFIFDDPRDTNSAALPLEGVPGLGDSGGPALMETPQGMMIMGVALGEIDNPLASQQGGYGSISLYERVSTHYAWMMLVIGSD